MPGNYVIEGKVEESGEQRRLAGFSLNIPPEECDLSRVPAMEIEPFSALLALDRSDTLDKALQSTETSTLDLMPYLMLALLFALAIETCWRTSSTTTRARINPKSEIRNPKQIQNSKQKCSKHTQARFGHWISEFGFVSDFGFRISDFLPMNWSDITCSLNPTWPDWLPNAAALPTFLAAAILLALLTFWTYLGVRGTRIGRILLVLLLRLTALAIALLVALRPSVGMVTLEGLEPSKLLIVVDVSESMNVPDEFNSMTRWDKARHILADPRVKDALNGCRRMSRSRSCSTMRPRGLPRKNREGRHRASAPTSARGCTSCTRNTRARRFAAS